MAAKTALPPVPAALADVALVDGPTCAAAGAMSLSAWHELVRTKEAPQPVIRQVRCTRWRLIDVRQFLIDRAAHALHDAEAVTARAKKASAAAQAKRSGRLAAVEA
jgi:predicted DNA-binding transcriptional regulator AlpA